MLLRLRRMLQQTVVDPAENIEQPLARPEVFHQKAEQGNQFGRGSLDKELFGA